MDNPLQRLGIVNKSPQATEVHMENIGLFVLPGLLLFIAMLGYMWWSVVTNKDA